MNVICLQRYDVCKYCNFMIIHELNTDSHVSYFSVCGIILLLMLMRAPLNVLLRGYFKNIFLPLYAPITSEECHHLNAASPDERNTEHYNKPCPR